MKKIITLCLLMISFSNKSFAEFTFVKSITDVELNSGKNEFYTVIEKETKLKNGIILPKKSILYSEIIKVVPEKHCRRNAYIIVKPIALDTETEVVPLENYNLEARTIQHKFIEKPNIKKIGIETGIKTGVKAASVLVPGAEQFYHVSKGLLIPDENKTRFEAVRDNFIDSTPLRHFKKGQKLDIQNGDRMILKIKSNPVSYSQQSL